MMQNSASAFLPEMPRDLRRDERSSSSLLSYSMYLQQSTDHAAR